MAPTTSYGSWNYVTGQLGEVGISGAVISYLGEFGEDFDVDGLTRAYDAAIDKEMSKDRSLRGVTLAGDEFYGPYPMPEDAHDRINAAIERVDLDKIAERFDRSR